MTKRPSVVGHPCPQCGLVLGTSRLLSKHYQNCDSQEVSSAKGFHCDDDTFVWDDEEMDQQSPCDIYQALVFSQEVTMPDSESSEITVTAEMEVDLHEVTTTTPADPVDDDGESSSIPREREAASPLRANPFGIPMGDLSQVWNIRKYFKS
jgi:hypothetical protein